MGPLSQYLPKLVHTDVHKCITNDPALKGYDSARFVFTDISVGVRNSERIIVVREPDGTLNYADYNMRKRLNQIYFPRAGCELKEPEMFTNISLFQNLLAKAEYEFILNRACAQYDPDDAEYQRITAQVFQDIDEKKAYEILRSTRHFGPMTFYLAWHNMIDGLMLDLLQNGIIREAVTLISLQRILHPELVAADDSQVLIEQILQSQNNQTVNTLSELDIDLDEKCIECVYKYIQNNSSNKSQQELALQTFRELYKQKVELEKGIKMAHGLK